MNLEEYEELPDGMSSDEVAALLSSFLLEQRGDSRDERFRKLDLIGDRQWHTYELATPATRDVVIDWIESNWETTNEFLELTMGLCYCFGLPRKLFERALAGYGGDQKWEYQEMLEHAGSETIDPYWSLRPTDLRQNS